MTALRTVRPWSSMSRTSSHHRGVALKFRRLAHTLPLAKHRHSTNNGVHDEQVNPGRTTSSVLSSLRHSYAGRGSRKPLLLQKLPVCTVAFVSNSYDDKPAVIEEDEEVVATNGVKLLSNKSVPSVVKGDSQSSSKKPRRKKRRFRNNGDRVSIVGARRFRTEVKFDVDYKYKCSGDDEDDDMDDDHSYSDDFWKQQRQSYRIEFESHATVVEIPHRYSYTKEQRSLMWNGSKAIRANAKRNRIEFEWEGREWQDAVEEDDFCDYDGEKVHPAHVPIGH